MKSQMDNMLIMEKQGYIDAVKGYNKVLSMIIKKKPAVNFRGMSLPRSSKKTIIPIAKQFGYSDEDLDIHMIPCFEGNNY